MRMTPLEQELRRSFVLCRDFDLARRQLRPALKNIQKSGYLQLRRIDHKKWDVPDTQKNNNCYNAAIIVINNAYQKPGLLYAGICERQQARLANDNYQRLRRSSENALSALPEEERAALALCAIKAHGLRSGACADGLQSMGLDMAEAGEPRLNGFPAALFVNSESYHWYGLKGNFLGQAVWTEKMAQGPIRKVRDIFTSAKSQGFPYFAGYFLRPAALDME